VDGDTLTQCYRRSASDTNVAWGQAGEFHRGCDNKGTWSIIWFSFDNGNSFAFATDQVWGRSGYWNGYGNDP
jgi:hypothetical protein